MEDHYETLPATRDTDDHIYLELMNNSKPKLPPNRLKSIENLVVKEMQYKDKKTRNSVTTQSLENVILPTSNASHVNTKINKRVLIGICVAVVVGCLVVGMTVGILVSSSKTEEHEANSLPAVTISKSAYTVKPGSSVTLNCIVSFSANINNVFWQRTVDNDVTVIQINTVKYSGSTPSIPSLTINNADLRDDGQYQCFAENDAGTGQSAFTTVTVDNVPAVTVLKSAYTVKAGSSVTLNCIVSSSTNINNVFWQRTVDNDVTVIQINVFKYSGSTPSIPSLTINNANLKDAGQYQCFAENNAGTGQSAFTTVTVDKPCGLLKDGWKNFKGHYYIFITTVKTWENAEEDCRYFGARLAEVQSRDEGQWLKNQARRKGGDWWLGASDEENNGQWHWTSGNTLEQYTNWAPNKPDNNYGQDCLQMWAWANYLWDDQTCTNKINYICEKSSC